MAPTFIGWHRPAAAIATESVWSIGPRENRTLAAIPSAIWVLLLRRIHGLPGTTYSSPLVRGKYQSEANATMTISELERRIALEIGGSTPRRLADGVVATANWGSRPQG